MARRILRLFSCTLMFAVAACGSQPLPATATLSSGSTVTVPTLPSATPSSAAMTAVIPAGTGSALDGVFGTNGPIPIGVAIALTGPSAAVGADEANGAMIAESYFNEHGGVNGRRIKIVIADTGADEAGAVRAFTGLINDDRVVGIVGPTSSQQALAAAPTAIKGKTPMISPSANAQGVTQIGEYVSRTSAPVTAIAPIVLKTAIVQKPDAKRLAVFYAQNDAASVSEVGVFQDTAKALGLTVVSAQKFVTGDANFAAQITDALNQRAEIATVSAPLIESSLLIQQLRAAGFKGIIAGGDGVDSPGIFPVCKLQCDGVISAQAYIPDAPNSPNTTFKFAFAGQFKKDPPQFAAQTFTAIQVFVEALRVIDMKQSLAARPLAQIRTELNTQAHAGKYTTPLGDISFDQDRDIVQSTFYPVQLKVNPDGVSGKFVFLK